MRADRESRFRRPGRLGCPDNAFKHAWVREVTTGQIDARGVYLDRAELLNQAEVGIAGASTTVGEVAGSSGKVEESCGDETAAPGPAARELDAA